MLLKERSRRPQDFVDVPHHLSSLILNCGADNRTRRRLVRPNPGHEQKAVGSNRLGIGTRWLRRTVRDHFVIGHSSVLPACVIAEGSHGAYCAPNTNRLSRGARRRRPRLSPPGSEDRETLAYAMRPDHQNPPRGPKRQTNLRSASSRPVFMSTRPWDAYRRRGLTLYSIVCIIHFVRYFTHRRRPREGGSCE